jgi:hypothetical protein
LRPFLEYMQELYTSPIRLDGFRTMDYPCMVSNPDEIMLRAKNFKYDRPRSNDFKNSLINRVLNTIKFDAASVKKGVITTLIVHVPKRRDHPFWYRTFTESKKSLFNWDISEDAVSFQVTRWGPLEEYSRFYTTQRAMDIIQNIRAAVSNPIYVSLWAPRIKKRSNSHNFSCPILQLGMELNDMWRRTNSKFLTACSREFVKDAVEKIQKWIDSEKYILISPLLRYYQVGPFGFD